MPPFEKRPNFLAYLMTKFSQEYEFRGTPSFFLYAETWHITNEPRNKNTGVSIPGLKIGRCTERGVHSSLLCGRFKSRCAPLRIYFIKMYILSPIRRSGKCGDYLLASEGPPFYVEFRDHNPRIIFS